MRRIMALLMGLICLNLAAAQPAPAEVPATEVRSRTVLVQALGLSERLLPDPAWLREPAWQDFKKQVLSWDDAPLGAADLARRFNAQVGQSGLKFSHFQLLAPAQAAREPMDPAPVVHAEGPGIVRLQIPLFSARPDAMLQALVRVAQLRPQHLIVDLRGTPGGALPSALALAGFLSSQPLDVGVFVSRAWFDRNQTLPSANTIQQLSPQQVSSLAAMQQALQREGVLRLQLPAAGGPTYEGVVYVLIDQGTASAAEPVAYLLQQQRHAVVLGERSAGAMLSSVTLPLPGGLALTLPLADYVAPDGRRLEGQGVQPDYRVASAEALDRVLGLIRQGALRR